jgi:aldehyde:ferredoxin oxidoreductase
MPGDLAEGLKALGWDIGEEELFRAGERIVALERMYNVRHGFSRKDDTLPKRMIDEPLDVYVHPEDIEKVPPEKAELVHRGLKVDLQPMLDEYYEIGGWDSKGIPTAYRLRELGLDFCII